MNTMHTTERNDEINCSCCGASAEMGHLCLRCERAMVAEISEREKPPIRLEISSDGGSKLVEIRRGTKLLAAGFGRTVTTALRSARIQLRSGATW